ncbi:MAG: tetratricopeptide repeat protein, partial [Candidatus Nealsonbacteria bacterium]|nr:tetratricopeptide repeat protein [Candidatus Nealsonbacteria bacterium]
MKTLNLRLVIILGVCAIVLLTVVYFGHGFQNRRNAGFYYRQAETSEQQAKEAEGKGDLETAKKEKEQAIKQLAWYLNLRPDDVDAQEKQGLLMADLAVDPKTKMIISWNMFSPAWIKLENVVGQDPTRSIARRRLIDLAMHMGRRRHADARRHIEVFIESTPKDAELWDLLGQCQGSAREFDEAIESYEKSIELDPSRLDSYDHLARLLRYREDDPDKADEWMQKLVEVNAESAPACVLYGKYLSGIGLNNEALEQAIRGLELAADDKDSLQLTANCASAKIREDWIRSERGLGDVIPGIEATLELSEDGQTVSRIMVGPVKEDSAKKDSAKEDSAKE